MGVGESKSVEILRYVQREWQFLKQQNGVRVLRNQETEKQADMLPLLIDPRRNIDKEYEIYNYRRTQENALVTVFAVQNQKNSESSICGNTQVLRVVIERIPLRYKDLPQLPFREVLYALSESIRGFDDCFTKIGSFEITSKMIGINLKGKVKVWLNENFANNHPCDEKPMLQMTCANEMKLKISKQQLLMLQNLLSVIEEKCEKGRFPEDFRSKIYGKSNFVDAYNQIETYCGDKCLQIPDRIILNSSQSNTSNSISLNKSNSQTIEQNNPQFATSKYEPRQTLIQNLSFSQNKDKQFYIQSPQLKKYEVQEQRPLTVTQKSFRVPYQQPLSPRYTQPSQIRFNNNGGNQPQIRFSNF